MMFIFTDKTNATGGTANKQHTISHPQLFTVQIYITKSVFDISALMTAGTEFVTFC